MKKSYLLVAVTALTLYPTSTLLFAAAESKQQKNPETNRSETILIKIFMNLKQTNQLSNCKYFNKNCTWRKMISDVQLISVAKKYGVVSSSQVAKGDIRIGLMQGNSADIPGIGTGYEHNRNLLKLNSQTWY